MIRGTKRKIDKNENVTRINPTVKASIHNRFDIEVVDAKTGKVKQKAYAENVVLDNWWTTLFETSYGASASIAIGSGSGIPSSTDKDLFERIGFATGIKSENKRKDCTTFSRTVLARISETQYVGKVITEIGFSNGNSSSSILTTHAMLKDMNGNQISILKTETDIINFAGTVFVHLSQRKFDKESICVVPLGSSLSSSGGHGINDNYTYRNYSRILLWMAGGASYSSAFPSDESILYSFDKAPTTLGVVSLTSDTKMTFAFSKSAKTVKMTIPRQKVTENNGEATVVTVNECHGGNYNGGVRYVWTPFLVLSPGGDWYNGTDVKKESIGTGDGTTLDFSTKFSFAENAKIYINGEEQNSGFEVSRGLCSYGSALAGRYLSVVTEDSTLEDVYYSPAVVTHADNSLSVDMNYVWHKNGIYCIHNPNYLEIPITTISFSNPAKLSVYGKTDSDEWTFISSITGSSKSITLGTNSKNYAFYKLVFEPYSNNRATSFNVTCDTPTVNNIHFDEPPPDGAIITADYFTKTIAKDENHVFDLSLTIQLGEYTGE